MSAHIFEADMANFNVSKKFDAAYCTVDTFRHLLTEKDALSHLERVGNALKKKGIYVLGMHLLTEKEISSRVIHWKNRRGGLTVKSSMSFLELDKRRRLEKLKVVLQASTSQRKEKHTSVYSLRTYTLQQLKRLLAKTKQFQIIAAYDEYYDLDRTIQLDDRSEYAVLLLQKI